MLNLSNITLLCVETRTPELAHWAMDQCLQKANFAKVVLLTDLRKLDDRRSDIHYYQAPFIKTTEDYSSLLLTGIRQYVEGTHVLIIQWDSFITNPELWSDGFLAYDYIGPVWPHHPQTPVGNGGFSLRSVRLLEALLDPKIVLKHPEDYCICVDNKSYLERQHQIQFAPVEVAEQFAVERSLWHPAFGFHGFFNFARVLSEEQLAAILKIIPNSYLRGVDTYDLVDYLLSKNKLNLTLLIGSRVQFSWRLRYRYISMKVKIAIKTLCHFRKK